MIFTGNAKNNIPSKKLTANSYPPATPEQTHSCDGGRGKLKANLGFTLIEMLVVIAIIGILYLIVFGSVSDSKKRGRDSKRIADISVIQLALERYYDRYHYYPATLDDTNLKSESPIPTDPQNNIAYKYFASSNSTLGAGCNNSSVSCQYYHLGATLELNNNVLIDDKDFNSGTRGDFNGSDSSTVFVYDVLPKF